MSILRPEPMHDKAEIAALRHIDRALFHRRPSRKNPATRKATTHKNRNRPARSIRAALSARSYRAAAARRFAYRQAARRLSARFGGGSGFLSAQLSRMQSLEDPFCASARCAPPAKRPRTRTAAARRRLAETVMSSDLRLRVERGPRPAGPNRSQLQRKLKRDRSGRYGPAMLQLGASA